ncbi:hypothetical protein AXX17_AT5G61870 [Arabidopsis thaliana]|uniref:Transmembrane protein n=1 Tax=Arabidopsis thaliana TaxID=3702 RepID=A0A178U985_ARATH|nr:hypothetical protein AXX17_AT5G61870 [Arabidopsis thaliana]
MEFDSDFLVLLLNLNMISFLRVFGYVGFFISRITVIHRRIDFTPIEERRICIGGQSMN